MLYRSVSPYTPRTATQGLTPHTSLRLKFKTKHHTDRVLTTHYPYEEHVCAQKEKIQLR